MSETAQALIDRLRLAPHPEGGWYRETWRGAAGPDGRASETLIFFLLDHGQASHWHTVDATEIWCWHAGSALDVGTAPGDAGPVTWHALGADFAAGQTPQLVIPPHHWQAARATHGWALVSCMVSPGFEFSGFVLAAPGWEPGQ
jgi:predicted cupin superfamily sugar epimerase